jgi:hypothetical protein
LVAINHSILGPDNTTCACIGRAGAISVGETVVADEDAFPCADRSRRPPISTSDEAGDGGRAVVRAVGDEDEDDTVSKSPRCEVGADRWDEPPDPRREKRLAACCRVRRVPRMSSQLVLRCGDGISSMQISFTVVRATNRVGVLTRTAD